MWWLECFKCYCMGLDLKILILTIKYGIETRNWTDKGNIGIEMLVLEKVVLGPKQVLALKKVPLKMYFSVTVFWFFLHLHLWEFFFNRQVFLWFPVPTFCHHFVVERRGQGEGDLNLHSNEKTSSRPEVCCGASDRTPSIQQWLPPV